MKKIAFIGIGNMGRSIAVCMAQKCSKHYEFAASSHTQKSLDALSEYPFARSLHNKEVCQHADYIFLCVKPNKIQEVLEEIRTEIAPSAFLISIAAGVDLASLAAWSGHPPSRLVRLMPNLAAQIAFSVTAFSVHPDFPKEEEAELFHLIQSFGSVWPIEERLMDAVPAVAGSSPAYVFMMIDALADGAVRDGIPRATALSMAALAIEGAARLFSSGSIHPMELKDRVCSPGGTTIAAVAQLEKHGFRNALLEAMDACTKRNQELSKP